MHPKMLGPGLLGMRVLLPDMGGCELAERAVVVGAGIIGLMAAYHLRRRGLDVTVLDRGEPGMACSFGNAGFICPSLCAPLPAPGLVGRSLRWMLHRQSPLYIKPGALPQISGWLLDFWRHCNAQDHEAGLAAMLTLNQRTLALYDALAADGVSFEMHDRGLLVVFLRQEELAQELAELRKVEPYGFPAPQVLDREQVLGEEPSLSQQVVGGVLLPAERHVEPGSLSRGILRWLVDAGVEVRHPAEAEVFETRGDTVVAVQAGGQRVHGDLFVLAAGAWTGRLAALLGVHLPIQAGKGYSVTFTSPNLQFRHALYFGDTKAVLSQYDGSLRIAGTMEFSGFNTNLDQERISGLRSAARSYLRAELHGASESEWTGMRPMTPDGLPVIGRLPRYRNAFVSTGHAANGVFMAPASGDVLAQMAVDGQADVDMHAFDALRFAAR